VLGSYGGVEDRLEQMIERERGLREGPAHDEGLERDAEDSPHAEHVEGHRGRVQGPDGHAVFERPRDRRGPRFGQRRRQGGVEQALEKSVERGRFFVGPGALRVVFARRPRDDGLEIGRAEGLGARTWRAVEPRRQERGDEPSEPADAHPIEAMEGRARGPQRLDGQRQSIALVSADNGVEELVLGELLGVEPGRRTCLGEVLGEHVEQRREIGSDARCLLGITVEADHTAAALAS
jgi:hypothetical protein